MLSALLLAALLIGGCRQKFTRVNYETIYIGMESQHVRRRIGPPTEAGDRRWVYVNPMPYYRAEILFDQADRVDGKSWSYSRPDDDGDAAP
jgi:hypothetical protein